MKFLIFFFKQSTSMSLSSSFCLLLTIEMINLAFCIRTLFNSLTSRRHFLNCAFAIKEPCGILRARLWIRIAVHFLFTVTAPTRKLTEHHFPQPFGCLWKWNYIKLLITQHFLTKKIGSFPSLTVKSQVSIGNRLQP